MFLTKKGILSIIAITGLAFMILLIIQFGWIRKSMDINRRHFADRMVVVSNNVRVSFLTDKALQKKWLSGKPERLDLYSGDVAMHTLEAVIKKKLDSVLEIFKMPPSSALVGRLDSSCYYMSYIPPDQHIERMDLAPYKICLCSNNFPVRMDIGFDLYSDNLLGNDSSGLILPSVILILLLIALFAYIIYGINRQKILAELKNDFINNLTHEFNTPLFSIGLTSTLLARADPVQQNEKLKGYVELITTEKNRLQSQVDRILRLTAVESVAGILEKECVDVHALISQNLTGFKPVVSEKGGNIFFQPGASQHIIQGDPLHLFNALNNLIDNAIKYSDGLPDITITTRNVEGKLEISVKDNGIGLSANEIHMIFKKFYRVKKGDRHDVKGFGIGLSYVKKIVELHEGSIKVESNPGKGSEFVIQFPCQS
jgi:two-component system, OmpR family, phosphate regulon sensor histidine kinase PhoR